MEVTRTQAFVSLLIGISLLTGYVRFSQHRPWLRMAVAEPPPPDMKLLQGLQSCMQTAKESPEPYTSLYDFKPEGVDLAGKAWAEYSWPGNITREQFDDGLYWNGINYIPFKIVDNQLYMDEQHLASHLPFERRRISAFVDQLIITMGWYKLPDVDFLASFKHYQVDKQTPALVIAFSPFGEKVGFSIPGPTAIWNALGEQQLGVLHKCLMERYPLGKGRIPKAVWRGGWLRMQYTDSPRPNLVRSGTSAQDVTDIRFTSYTVGGLESFL